MICRQEREVAGGMRSLSRRTVLLSGLGTMVAAATGRDASAAACPELSGETIRWIVPYGAGGGYDTLSRLLAPALEKVLEATLVIDNVSGAGGLLGARALRDSPADGRTLGLINGSGLLGAMLAGNSDVPAPDRDFTVLGRLQRDRHAWFTGPDSPIRGIEDLAPERRDQPIVVAVLGAASTLFVSGATVSRILGIEAVFVAGHKGSKAARMALLRGEIDVMSLSFDSARRHVEAGRMRPLLQIADRPIADDPSLSGVPLLGGPDGIAARWAERAGRDAAEAIRLSAALAALLAAGRIVAAPAGLAPSARDCLAEALEEAMAAPEFTEAVARAGHTLDPAPAPVAERYLAAAAEAARALSPILAQALAWIRS